MDDLVLNLAEAGPSTRAVSNKKGGRWTERVKAKQVAKRKVRVAEAGPDEAGDATAGTGRAIKRRKTDSASTTKPKDASTSKPPTTSSTSRPSTQIISSLFSHNPAVNAPAPSSNRLSTGIPSNAPINSSSFSGLGLDPLLIAHLASKFSIDKPTSIQRAALPALLKPSTSNPRDAFIQSQTGSGKTLSFLLPIIQDLLPLSSLSWIDRSVGTLAIIIAPTRELAKQISDVLELLLKMRLRGADESAEDAAADRRTRWLVSGVLTGGATRTHEKARLRKGLPILVATPGRLLDHLQNTASFDAGKVRWLVLDEADRLMELGFAETLGGILKALDGRRRLAMQAVQEGVSADVGGWDWEVKRRNVLCSATIREDVQKLAGIALSNPVVIKATEKEEELGSAPTSLKELDAAEQAEAAKFTPPAQLSQRYVVVPLKLRLVTLVSLLRSLLSQTQAKRGAKVIVFFSCTDSVDFHFRLLAEASMNAEAGATVDEGEGSSDDDDEEGGQDPSSSGDKVSSHSVLLPGASVFRLHGSLALAQRMACLKGFASSTSPAPAVLLCTSVASRGLDLPLVRAVVQYDLPTEGGATEYVHRVGRTARAGRGGEAWAIIAPSETAWAPWVAGRMREEAGEVRLQQQGLDAVLKSGFGGKGAEFEARATEVQLAFERWALTNKEHTELARKAYLSHIRAYATHPSEEKHIFHVKHLHLGHLAKAFALREAPSAVTKKYSSGDKPAPAKSKSNARQTTKDKDGVRKDRPAGKEREREHEWQETYDPETEARMSRAVREQGRLSKHKGKLVSSGASEFQVAGGDALEALVRAR